MERKFYRKSYDKVFGGVCSGLADYIGVDTSLVRLVTLIGIIASSVFPGLFLYFLCVIIVPYDTQAARDSYDRSSPEYEDYNSDRPYTYSGNSGNARIIIGLGLIALGVFFFARMFFAWLDWRYVCAGLLILGGLYMLLGHKKE